MSRHGVPRRSWRHALAAEVAWLIVTWCLFSFLASVTLVIVDLWRIATR